MNIKIDKTLFKYLIIIIVIYYLVSKMNQTTLPGNNPFILTSIIIFIFYIIDQPTFLTAEYFTSPPNTQVATDKYNNLDYDNTVKHIVSEVITELTAHKELNNILSTSQSFELHNAQLENAELKNKQLQQQSFAKQDTEMLVSGLPSTSKIIKDTSSEMKQEKCNCDVVAEKAITRFLQNRRMLDTNGMLHYADNYIGDMGYSQIKLDKYIPLGEPGNGVYNSWDLSNYSIINSDRWKPSTDIIPSCKKGDVVIPQPISDKEPTNLLNWDYSRKILPPDDINTNFINKQLNA